MIEHNYRELDRQHRFKYREDWLEAANDAGYQYIHEAIVKEYRKEKSGHIVARLFGVRPHTIMLRLHNIGEPVFGRGKHSIHAGRRHPQWQEMVRLRKKGIAVNTIARQFDVHPATVRNYIREDKTGWKPKATNGLSNAKRN